MSPAIAALVNGVSGSPSTNGLMSRTQMYFGPACCQASSPTPGPGVCVFLRQGHASGATPLGVGYGVGGTGGIVTVEDQISAAGCSPRRRNNPLARATTVSDCVITASTNLSRRP